MRPEHWLSQHRCKGHAHNVQIRTTPALISRERTTAQIGGDASADRNWGQSLSVIGTPSRGSLIRLERQS